MVPRADSKNAGKGSLEDRAVSWTNFDFPAISRNSFALSPLVNIHENQAPGPRLFVRTLAQFRSVFGIYGVWSVKLKSRTPQALSSDTGRPAVDSGLHLPELVVCFHRWLPQSEPRSQKSIPVSGQAFAGGVIHWSVWIGSFFKDSADQRPG